ncbi:MAG: calcium-binding protein [Hyphomicrobiales bacterium]|nr:MAG: calcium-binding protein [Hyphomicrobiales bacterium]
MAGLILAVYSGPIIAHSGGLNASGCHAGSKPYHCHKAGAKKSRARSDSLSGQRQSRVGPDRNCKDFASWEEAQEFFENAGLNDPHALDHDRDGIACEMLD